MHSWGKDFTERWRNLPDNLKPYSILTCRGERAEVLNRDCARAQQEGIPVIAFIRTWYPEVLGKFPSIEELDKAFASYTVLKGVLICETGAGGFTDGERDYVMRAIETAAKYGRYIFWDIGHGVWAEVGTDKVFCDVLRRNKGTMIPLLEMNIAYNKYETHSRVLGLWLSGLVENWGINPQGWYWGEAGFMELNTSYGFRLAKLRPKFRGIADKNSVTRTTREFEDKVNSMFPMMGQDIMFGCASGATVFWFGGERPPNAWRARDGSISRWWLDTIKPFLTEIVKRRLIVPKETLRKNIRIACAVEGTFPFVWDEQCAASGKRSVRIENGCAGTIHLRWQSGYVPVRRRGEKFTFSFKAKLENCDGTVDGVISWYNAKDMTWRTSAAVSVGSGTKPWGEYSTDIEPDSKATHFCVGLRSRGAYRGRAWFDDVSVHAAGSNENLIPNGDFEDGDPERGRPIGWHAAVWGTMPDAARRGLNAVWKATYGIRHWAEFIPNNGKFGWIPVLPHHCPREVRDSFRCVIRVNGETTPLEITQRISGLNAADARGGFVLNFGDIAFASNSHENTDETERASFHIGDYKIEADLGVHNYLVARLLKDSLFLLVENRYERTSKLRIFAKHPLRVVEKNGDVALDTDENGRQLSLTVKHNRIKLATLILQ